MNSRQWLRALVGIWSVTSTLGCEPQATRAAFPIVVSVVDDREEPLEGAVFEAGGVRGTTDSAGLFKHSLPGVAGASLPVRMDCPAKHSLEGALLPLELRPFYAVGSEGALKTIEYRVSCLRKTRSVVLAVQAWPGLPVAVNGQKAGVSDANGIVHLAFELPPESDLDVKLDTTDAPRLRPQNPTRSFHIQEDEVLLFAQAFQEERPKVKVVRARAKRAPHIPQRL